NYTTPVQVIVTGDLTYTLTNSEGFQSPNHRIVYPAIGTNVGVWAGSGYNPNRIPAPQSFVVPIRTNFAIVPSFAYNHALRTLVPLANPAAFEAVYPDPVVWQLYVTNHLRALIREAATGRVLDYVQFDGPGTYRNLSEEIRTPNGAQYFSG